MNLLILTGRLAKDPDVKKTDSGMVIARFPLAVDRPVKAGEEKKADFLYITSFGKTAELVKNFLTKGRQIGIQGCVRVNSYTNKNGEKVYSTEIIAERLEFLGSKSDNTGASSSSVAPSASIPEGFTAIDDEDLPF